MTLHISIYGSQQGEIVRPVIYGDRPTLEECRDPYGAQGSNLVEVRCRSPAVVISPKLVSFGSTRRHSTTTEDRRRTGDKSCGQWLVLYSVWYIVVNITLILNIYLLSYIDLVH